jgi:anti-sigma regulatory factor (Ser/Thr protein kinase)
VASREFPAIPEVLPWVRRFIAEQATRDTYRDHVDELLVAVTEAASNAIRHSGSRTFEVTWTAGETESTVEVRDSGVFKPRIPIRELDGDQVRGIPLILTTTEGLDLTPGTTESPGTIVRFRKVKSPRVGPGGFEPPTS